MTRARRIISLFVSSVECLNRLMAVMAAVLVCVMALVMLYEVVSRYAFNRPTFWTVEISQYLMVAVGVLAAAYVQQLRGHVRVDIILLRLSPRLREILDLLSHAAGLTFCVFLAWKSWDMAWHSFQLGQRSPGLLSAPLWPAQMLIPLASFFLGLQLLFDMVRDAMALFRSSGISEAK